MGVTAENLAEKYSISADDCNQFAFRSQQRWKQAHDAGVFESEMAPVEVKTKKGKVGLLHLLLHVCILQFKHTAAVIFYYSEKRHE